MLKEAPSVTSVSRLLLCAWLLALAATPTEAAQIQDVSSILNSRLATKGHVTRNQYVEHQVQECHDGCCGHLCEADCTKCHTVTKGEVVTVTDVPTLTNIEIVSVSNLAVDNAQVTQLPDQIYRKEVVFINCSKSEQTFTQGFSLAVTTSESATMTRTVTTSLSATAKADWDFGAYGKYGISLTGSRAVALTDTSTQGTSATTTHSFTDPIKVQPGNIGTGALWVFTMNMQAPFSGTIIFDGPLVPNNEGYVRASQLLSVAERTISVEGVLAVTSASKTFNGIWENSTDCSANSGTSSETLEFSGAVGTVTTLMDPYRGVDNALLVQLGLAPNGRSLKARSIERQEKSKVKTPFLTGGTPGDYCYIGPCNRPLDGYRPICRYDGDGACFDCYDEAESICDPTDDEEKH